MEIYHPENYTKSANSRLHERVNIRSTTLSPAAIIESGNSQGIPIFSEVFNNPNKSTPRAGADWYAVSVGQYHEPSSQNQVTFKGAIVADVYTDLNDPTTRVTQVMIFPSDFQSILGTPGNLKSLKDIREIASIVLTFGNDINLIKSQRLPEVGMYDAVSLPESGDVDLRKHAAAPVIIDFALKAIENAQLKQYPFPENPTQNTT
ncbi:MAG: hypothetical protein Q7S61_01150 [bacterium]|nr:hypothetical protein [bacterium]